jgi:hypothetical protein
MFRFAPLTLVTFVSALIACDSIADGMLVSVVDESRPLNADGTYVMPDLGAALVNPEYPLTVTTMQSPTPGTLLTGVQTVTVSVTATDSAEAQEQASFLIHLIDLTPPTMSLGLQSAQTRRTTPDGVPYYVTPCNVYPSISATDTCDSNPTLHLWVDGEPWTGLLPVNTVGLHTFYAHASDDSGNSSHASLIFDIRDRPFHSAVMAVEEMLMVDNGSGIESISATVLVGAEAFSVIDINLATVHLWLTDDHGKCLTAGVPILGAYPVHGGPYGHETCEAMYESGYWTLPFEAVFNPPLPSNSVSMLSLTGGGLHDEPEKFDFKSSAAASVDPDPIVTLGQASVLNEDPPLDPLAQTAPLCRWVHEWDPDPDDHFVRAGGTFCDWIMDLLAAGSDPTIRGHGYVYDECMGTENDGGASAVISGGTLTVRLEPPNCCEDCDISVVARPSFKVKLAVNAPAQSAAGGKISIATPCGNAEAIGGAAIGDFDQETVELFGYEVPVYPETAPEAYAFTDNLSCVHEACSIQVSISTSAWMHIYASSNWLNWFAWAQADIFAANVGLTITPSADCPNVAPSTPIEITFPDIEEPIE